MLNLMFLFLVSLPITAGRFSIVKFRRNHKLQVDFQIVSIFNPSTVQESTMDFKASKMAQRVKVLAAKPDDLRSIPRISKGEQKIS